MMKMKMELLRMLKIDLVIVWSNPVNSDLKLVDVSLVKGTDYWIQSTSASHHSLAHYPSKVHYPVSD
jgi:hypothetical protein